MLANTTHQKTVRDPLSYLTVSRGSARKPHDPGFLNRSPIPLAQPMARPPHGHPGRPPTPHTRWPAGQPPPAVWPCVPTSPHSSGPASYRLVRLATWSRRLGCWGRRWTPSRSGPTSGSLATTANLSGSIRAAATDRSSAPPAPRSIPVSDAPTGETSAGRPRRLSGASRSGLGVRRPITEPMPLERREQAIAALGQLILAGLERDAAALDADPQDRGRVVNRSR